MGAIDTAGGRTGAVVLRNLVAELGLQGKLRRCASHGSRSLQTRLMLTRSLAQAHCLGSALSVANHISVARSLSGAHLDRTGRQLWLEPALRGDVLASSALGFRRPSRLRLRRRRGELVVSGTLPPTLNLTEADFCIASVNEDEGGTGTRVLILPLNEPAVHIKSVPLGGLEPLRVGTAEIDEQVAPPEWLLNEPSRSIGTRSDAEEQFLACVAALEIAGQTLEETRRFLQARPFQDDVLANSSVVRQQFADLTGKYQIALAHVEQWRRWMNQEHPPAHLRGSAQLVLELVQLVVDRCLHLMGGHGFLVENGISVAHRDVQCLAELVLGLWSVADPQSQGAWICRQEPDPTPALHDYRREFREFAEKSVAPRIDEWEETETLPKEAFELFAERGIIGLYVPREHGGEGREIAFGAIVCEEMARIGAAGPCSSALAMANIVCPILVRHGSVTQKRRWLEPIVRGKAIASIAIAEPTGGSDLGRSIKTRAVLEGDSWVLSGEKKFITNAPQANILLVLARTQGRQGLFGMSFFLVPANSRGVHVSPLPKRSLKSSAFGYVRLEDCRIPADEGLVGRLNHGFLHAAQVLDTERLLVAVSAIALAKSCIERTATSLRLVEQPSRFAEDELSHLGERVDAGRAFAWQLIGEVSRGEVDPVRIALAKASLADLAQATANRCVLLSTWPQGLPDTIARRIADDIRVASVFAGTSETMRDFAGSRLLRNVRRRSRS
jgi:alkylation response protein AidB-like acyl-CoA dehydrogenase